MDKHAEAKVAFEAFSYSHKKEYVTWIEDAKNRKPAKTASTKPSKCSPKEKD